MTMPVNSVRPKKRPRRTSATAAIVPSTVAIVAERKADAERHPGGVEERLVVQQRGVPFGREAAPHRDQPRFVEGIDDEEQDRQIEEGEAEHDRGEVEGAEALHRSRSRARACVFWKKTIGTTRTRSRMTATVRGHRPVAVVEELVPQRLADHQRARSAEQVGDDELADRRDEDQHRAGDDAGKRKREGDLPEGSRAAASRGRRRPRAACGRAFRATRRAAAP